jgi:hypothetical protein
MRDGHQAEANRAASVQETRGAMYYQNTRQSNHDIMVNNFYGMNRL